MKRNVVVRAIATLLVVPLFGGCVQQSLRRWARDEVTVLSMSRGEHYEHWSVALDVHEVDGLDDGVYEIPVSDFPTMPPTHEGPDGIREVDQPGIGVLHRTGPNPVDQHWNDAWNHDYVRWSGWHPMNLDSESLAHPDLSRLPGWKGKRDPDTPPDFGTRLTRNSDRDYEIEIFMFDAAPLRWVRIGRVTIGRGTQSPALRKTTVVALYPFAILLDVVLTPFSLIQNQETHGCCCGPIPL